MAAILVTGAPELVLQGHPRLSRDQLQAIRPRVKPSYAFFAKSKVRSLVSASAFTLGLLLSLLLNLTSRLPLSIQFLDLLL